LKENFVLLKRMSKLFPTQDLDRREEREASKAKPIAFNSEREREYEPT
jgi:hypothetical protein